MSEEKNDVDLNEEVDAMAEKTEEDDHRHDVAVNDGPLDFVKNDDGSDIVSSAPPVEEVPPKKESIEVVSKVEFKDDEVKASTATVELEDGVVVDVTSNDDAAEEAEEVLEDLVAKRRAELQKNLTPRVNKDENVTKAKNNRFAEAASNVAPARHNQREGMAIGGPGVRRRAKQAVAKTQEETKERLTRRGIHKIYDDAPIKNVGDGTIHQDIARKRVE